MNLDKLISKVFFNESGVLINKYFKRFNKNPKKYINKYCNIKHYINTRYSDSESILETLYRIYYNIEIRPVCKTCGKHLKLNIVTKKHQVFPTFCSISCAMKDKDVMEKHNRACIEKYGTVNNSEKTKQTFLKKYNGTSSFNSPELVQKIKQTNIIKYGAENAFSNKDIQEKQKTTLQNKYNVESPLQLDKTRNARKSYESLQHEYNTKRINGTFNKSNAEDTVYNMLKTIYNDIIRQYSSDKYPFNCDFYIPSLDLYIEYNGSWTHGYHTYNKNDEKDIQQLNIWVNKKTKYYDNAIYTWTIRDVNKRNVAKQNNLNYIEFWNIDDVQQYINSYIRAKI